MKNVHYAGFWIRLVAYLIDMIILLIVLLIAGSIVAGLTGGILDVSTEDLDLTQLNVLTEDLDLNQVEDFARIVGTILGFVIQWLYFALQFSSKKQATLGMRAVGVKVVDYNYKRISFANATGRFFGMILSGFIIYIGFIMIAFTKRKQGLHDFMCKTYIIYD